MNPEHSLGGEVFAEDEIDLRQLFETLLRYWQVLLLATVLGALAAFGVSKAQRPIYEARTQVLVTRASSPLGGSGDLVQYASLRELTSTYSDFLKQDWVLEEVAQRVGSEVGKDQVKVSVPTNAMVINIAVQDPDPRRAETIADTLVDILVEQNESLQASRYTEAEKRLNTQIEDTLAKITSLKEQLAQAGKGDKEELQTELTVYQQIYLDLLDKRETLRLQKLQAMPNVVQVSPARAREEPVRPRTLMNTALGGMLGLLLAVGGVFLKEALDTSVRREEDLQALSLPLLTTVVKAEDLAEEQGPYVFQEPRSPYAEAMRLLRTQLEFLAVHAPLRSLLVTGIEPEVGKTAIATNLAAILAQAGKRVVLLDADLRRPKVHKVFNMVPRNGLTTVFRKGLSAVEASRQWKDTSLYVLPAGKLPPNPAELLSSQRMREILGELEEAFDAVVIDSPPGFLAETHALAAMVDGTLLVGEFGKTDRRHLARLLEDLRRAEARVLGAVFMADGRRGPGHRRYGYGAYYYYEYDAENGAKGKAEKKRAKGD